MAGTRSGGALRLGAASQTVDIDTDVTPAAALGYRKSPVQAVEGCRGSVTKERGSRRKRRGRRSGTRNCGPILRRHPLSGVDPAVIRSAMASIADRQRDDFPRFLGEVHDAMRRVDPIHLAAMIIGWGTMGAVG